MPHSFAGAVARSDSSVAQLDTNPPPPVIATVVDDHA